MAIIESHGGHELLRIESDASEAAAFEQLASAHAWQCVGARDEVPPHLLVTAEFLARTPNLLMVSSSGSGVDVFDIAACTEAGVLVVNQAGSNAQAVAEHAVAMMIGLLRHFGAADRALREGWQGPRMDFKGRDLSGKTVGVVGLGHIGQRTAKICAHGFGCTVLAHDPLLDDVTIRERGAQPVGWDDLLAQADVITVHTPLNDGTRGMFDAKAFQSMKAGAVFVCTARGSICNEQALAAALQSGHLAGAGMDVWEIEPPAASHPLLALPNVLATPHVAGVTQDSLENMAQYASTQMLDVLDGKAPARPINPDVLPVFEKRRRDLLGV